jgi:hypothetical protein
MKHKNLTVLALGFALALYGCNNGGSGMTADQEKAAGQLNKIAESSGGDWDKLSDAEKKQLTQQLGSEDSAKQILKWKAHPPEPVAPGPPSGWKPGGPPPSQHSGK